MAENENIIERRVKSLEAAELRVVRAADGKPTAIEGYAAVFEQWSEDFGWFREKIAPGAFKNALKTSDVRCLFNHDSDMILGRAKSGTLSLKEDAKGLSFRCVLPDAQDARDLATRIERGDIDGCSFQFTTQKDSWVYATKENELDERTILEIRELFDVGPVVFPAYPQTSVAAREKELGLEVARRSHDAAKPKGEAPPPATSATPFLDAAKARMKEAQEKDAAETQRKLDERITRRAGAEASE